MTLKQFREAVQIAKSDVDLSCEDISHLNGYGLSDFTQRVSTMGAIAKVIRWQAQQFNGLFDEEELSNCWYFFKKKIFVV